MKHSGEAAFPQMRDIPEKPVCPHEENRGDAGGNAKQNCPSWPLHPCPAGDSGAGARAVPGPGQLCGAGPAPVQEAPRSLRQQRLRGSPAPPLGALPPAARTRTGHGQPRTPPELRIPPAFFFFSSLWDGA